MLQFIGGTVEMREKTEREKTVRRRKSRVGSEPGFAADFRWFIPSFPNANSFIP